MKNIFFFSLLGIFLVSCQTQNTANPQNPAPEIPENNTSLNDDVYNPTKELPTIGTGTYYMGFYVPDGENLKISKISMRSRGAWRSVPWDDSTPLHIHRSVSVKSNDNKKIQVVFNSEKHDLSVDARDEIPIQTPSIDDYLNNSYNKYYSFGRGELSSKVDNNLAVFNFERGIPKYQFDRSNHNGTFNVTTNEDDIWGYDFLDSFTFDTSAVRPFMADNIDLEILFHETLNHFTESFPKISYKTVDGQTHEYPMDNFIYENMEPHPGKEYRDEPGWYGSCHEVLCHFHFPSDVAKNITEVTIKYTENTSGN